MNKPTYLYDMKSKDDVQDAIDGLEAAAETLKDYLDFGLKHDSLFESALPIVDKVSAMLREMSSKYPF